MRYLRSIKVAPNGHANAAKRRLRDNSVRYILETCSALMNYAQRHRHLSPYAENAFRTIEIGRVPVEDAKSITVVTPGVDSLSSDDTSLHPSARACY